MVTNCRLMPSLVLVLQRQIQCKADTLRHERDGGDHDDECRDRELGGRA